ncbi:MAG: bifunctional DNA-formamidopyrimidine glycosylase/DNA-(apurinic or apyrimidinic site) lyase [Candidatus Daviesbacteria bacterium]|nr:bifunctional DNA-formamidopyrimidine glycosylase/DNA-(apurinic or apyrimidinic site) lyase [Candidatus Daviesbacteria bacterium]
MPELPEVETIRVGLSKKIVGLKIQEIEAISPKSFLGNPQNVSGQKVLKVWRRAKVLGVDLTGNITLLFHLKMSGQLVYDGGGRFVGGHPTPDMVDQMPNKHTRVIFNFSDESKLFFNDQRRFGWVKLVDSEQVTGDSSIKNLGPEPLEKDFTWQILKNNLLRHKSQPVKVVIMDQTVVSGVGNIYASEACFDAKLDPRIKVKDLTDTQFKKLHAGIIKCLKAGIKYGGSTKTHFVDAAGHKGYFLDYAYVYWKNSHPCKICGTEIKKVTLGGRGTYYCPACQR